MKGNFAKLYVLTFSAALGAMIWKFRTERVMSRHAARIYPRPPKLTQENLASEP